MPFKDGWLSPSVENRNELIKVMRKFAPDLVFTHPNLDYHPDHRYTCQLVMDTSYMLNVPAVAEEEKIPGKAPAYFFSVFKKTPEAFAFGIDDVWERKIAALACHESQMYEWLPWVEGKIQEVPKGSKERLEWLSRRRSPRYKAVADAFREQVGEFIKLAEAFAPAPVGRTLTEKELKEIKKILKNE
jgi:LmbE family N-acetylglucosaminyl deacetylase